MGYRELFRRGAGDEAAILEVHKQICQYVVANNDRLCQLEKAVLGVVEPERVRWFVASALQQDKFQPYNCDEPRCGPWLGWACTRGYLLSKQGEFFFMKYWYNRFHRDAGYGYRLCHKGDFWSSTLCDAVERAVTGAFQNSRIEIRLGQTVQQSGWVTAGGRRYYMICNIVKEADKESGARNIYTADFFLVELKRKRNLFFQ